MVFENELIKKIIEEYRVIWALGHAGSLMGWDTEVNMPREGVKERGIASAEISKLSQKLLLRPEFVKLVEEASKIKDLNDYERGVVRVLQRAIRIARAIPPEIVGELARLRQ